MESAGYRIPLSHRFSPDLSRTDVDARNLFLDGLDRTKRTPSTIVTDGIISYANAYDETLRYKGFVIAQFPEWIEVLNSSFLSSFT
jgi:hypothetical protein